MMTTEELEVTAYMSGDTERADLLARIAELEQTVRELENQIDDTETLEEWERNNGPAQEYRQFFYDCFKRLSAYYPAPNISSDYDCSVIFDAIEAGEAAQKEPDTD